MRSSVFSARRLFALQWVPEIIAAAFLLCSAILPAMLLPRVARATTIAMDTAPALLPREGLYGYERLPDGSGVYSWTNGSGKLKLPNPGAAPTLRLKLLGPTQAPVPVEIRVGTLQLRFVARPEPRIYSIALPASPNERITLAIDSPQVHLHQRTLGIGIGDIRIAGNGGTPAQVVIALTIATLGGYALLRQARLPGWAAASLTLALQTAVHLWMWTNGWRYGYLSSTLFLLGGAGLAAVALERWRPPARASNPRSPAWSGSDTWALAILLGAALCVRLLYFMAPDPVGDLELSARRMSFLHSGGLAGAYTDAGDYLPLRLYWLWGMSKLVPLLGGSFTAPLPPITMLLIKLPGLLADLATIAIIYGWCRSWRSTRGAATITALYALAPPVWINVAWWGQVDAVLMLALLGTIVLQERATGIWSWLCWALALLIKTQAIVFAPLLLVCTLRQHGCRGLVRGAALASGLVALVCAPLVLAGQFGGLIQSYAGSVGRFPRTTVAAYNLWYLALNGGSARDTEYVFGTTSYRSAGLVLFGIAALLVCFALLRRSDAPARAEGAATLALAFFALPTQIHERYLFLALTFLVLRIASRPRLVALYLALVLTATLNILGMLKGFMPAVYNYMADSRLPLLLAALNLLVLGVLLGHLLLVTCRTTGTERRQGPGGARRILPLPSRQ
jgi:Gpi18-like mannosyltransferase